ncbi:MAG: hypothetical protein ABIK47_01010 [candidate division WOR-3 bacterium]
MISGMDEHKVNNFYKTYRWFDQLFKDIHGLLTVISNRYKVKVSDLYYQSKSVGPPLLPDPYYCAFKLKEKPEWIVGLVCILCPDRATEFYNDTLKNIITEPAVIVIASHLRTPRPAKHHYAYYVVINNKRFIDNFVVNDNTTFSGRYTDTGDLTGGDFKGFVVPLYAFSRQKLEERAKEENIGLEQALNKTIEELIVNPLNKLLGL